MLSLPLKLSKSMSLRLPRRSVLPARVCKRFGPANLCLETLWKLQVRKPDLTLWPFYFLNGFARPQSVDGLDGGYVVTGMASYKTNYFKKIFAFITYLNILHEAKILKLSEKAVTLNVF